MDGFYGYLITVTRYWFHGEHHSGSFRLNHPLYRNGDAYCRVVKTVMRAIKDGACLEERGPAFNNGAQDLILTFNIEICLLLAGE
jgi:hypothetical protein